MSAPDLRVHIAQIIDKGSRGVAEAGRAALNSASIDKYREFISVTQYTARTEDERVRAAQLFDSGGPQIKAEARIALEGPARQLHAFIEVGQYKAQQQDLLAATHVSQVRQLIAEAAKVAATAQQNAAEARYAAFWARNASNEAQQAAKEAEAKKREAQDHAARADQSAREAEASAAQAAASARTARLAANDAQQAAAEAAGSADQAQISAASAHLSASSAWAAADDARASATAAGKDAGTAAKAAKDAFNAAVTKIRAEEEARRKAAAQDLGAQAREQYRCGFVNCQEARDNPGRWCQHNEVACEILARAPAFEAAMNKLYGYANHAIHMGSLVSCADYDLWACGDLAQQLAFKNKLMLVAKILSRIDDTEHQPGKIPIHTRTAPGAS